MTNDYAIKVENVSKEFKLPHNKKSTLKQAAIGLVKRDNTYEVQKALQDVSFEIKKGEFFGIVGRNGSGKSTLLKIMAGVYTPTSGGVHVNGSLVPFIELGVGFNPELSGKDNVYLNGSLLGFSTSEMAEMYDDIVEFAELERFMDQKLKNYSSGMQVRLAFSIAIRAQGDILVLDEVLAVGDTAFQKKCHDYFRSVKDSGQTVVLVTHAMDTVEKYCDRAAILNNGELILEGKPEEVVAQYKMINTADKSEDQKEAPQEKETLQEVDIKWMKVNGGQNTIIDASENIQIETCLEAKKTVDAKVAMSIVRDDGTEIAQFSTEADIGLQRLEKNMEHIVTCDIKSKQIPKGVYTINAAIISSDKEYIARGSNLARFAINKKEKGKGGLINLDFEWNIKEQ